jgi:uncharacterized protein YecT (DUF1311 family)
MTDRKYFALFLAIAVLAACGKATDADASAKTAAPDAAVTDAAVTDAITADIVADSASPSPQSADEVSADNATENQAASLRASFKQCAAASGGVDVKMQDCIANEYEYQDGRLNANYAAIKRSFSADKMTTLKVAQRQWLRDRDGQCAWDAKTEGSAQRLQANYCLMAQTAKRADVLQSMLQGGAPSASTNSTAAVTANASLDAKGRLRVSLAEMTVGVRAANCERVTEALVRCRKNVELTLSGGSAREQRLDLAELYVRSRATAYRGPLVEGGVAGHSIVLSDIDGDGNEDLAVFSGMGGAYGGASYDVFLFDKTRRSFVRNEALSKLTLGKSGLFLVVDGNILASSKSGCCLHTTEKYALSKGQLMLTERVLEDSTGNPPAPKRTVFRMVDGKLKQTEQ